MLSRTKLALAVLLLPMAMFAHDLSLTTIDRSESGITVRTSLSHLARRENARGLALSAVEVDLALRRRLHMRNAGPASLSIDPASDTIVWQAALPFPGAEVPKTLFPEESAARTEVRSGAASGLTNWFRRFVAMGASHIFDGPDHIAFIVGLVLLGGSLRSLLLTVTSFTLAHSLTLALSVTGLLVPAPRLIEPLIALSIVGIAVENLLRKGSLNRRPYYAFAFGLVHGFGIAGPLRALGEAGSLLPFNVGVELAQGAIVLAVWPCLFWFAKHHRARAAMSLAIGILGTVWFVDRISPSAWAQPAPSPDTLAAKVDASFQPFAPQVGTHHDTRFFYVESDGMPDHRMMVGITAWQQQVPLPQSYKGDNAWRFPLFPQPAAQPLSAKEHFFRGAIAIAANGVPIFNPIKNDGVTDTFLAGELDEFGGHGGRADDYHYHLAPLHLQKTLGAAIPVAYALDGYAIYGLTEPDGSAPAQLDSFNGHRGADGVYHYHATKTYPYLNGGFHGEVEERDGQVDPQPFADPVRPAGEPLRGAAVTGFEKLAGNSYQLTYTVRGETRKIHYTMEADGRYVFEFIDGQGGTRTETYRKRGRGPGRGRGRGRG